MRHLRHAARALIGRTECLVTGTPILQQLHWLSVRQRVELKLAVLVYKALDNSWPHRIYQTIASSLPPPIAVSFNRQRISSALSLIVPVHVLEIELSLLLDHAFRTVIHNVR